ncbi:proline--tRNA ligase, partial [Candidatus Uhrbacteria bacterium]|nr:proline--tRNA ligase [Candidatus Uhrbacteria bacterium]
MLMSKRFPKTRRDSGGDLTRAHALLIQAGLIRQVSPGIWTLMPDGWRVLQNIHGVIFEMMEAAGVQNVQLPILQPREIWEQTGRWKKYVETKTMFTTQEYHYDAQYGLAPTAEEVVSFIAATNIESWRDLPVVMHQIGPKFRDEIRPRLGLLRGREFYMSDAYSFDRDAEGMKASYEVMKELYAKIFARLGLTRVRAVEADSGDIGGKGSVEYMALSEEVGEDTLLACDECGFGANKEVGAGDVGAVCHVCKIGVFKELRGIEIGHVFQL